MSECTTCGGKGSIHGQACECRIITPERESAIRADERAKVEAEIVAWLRSRAWLNRPTKADADAVERGEHRR